MGGRARQESDAADPQAVWGEPARRIPLRWGAYTPRYAIGLALIVAGITSVQLTTTYSLPFLAWGAIGQAAGWVVLPGSGWRRLSALFPAELAACLLLAGGGYSSAFAIVLWAWLLVRRRPRLAYLLVILPPAYGAAFSGGVLPGSIMVDYAHAWLVFVGGGLLTIGCSWLARSWAVHVSRRHARAGADAVVARRASTTEAPGAANPADTPGSPDFQAEHQSSTID